MVSPPQLMVAACSHVFSVSHQIKEAMDHILTPAIFPRSYAPPLTSRYSAFPWHWRTTSMSGACPLLFSSPCFCYRLIFIAESLDALFCTDPSSFTLRLLLLLLPLRKRDNVPPHPLLALPMHSAALSISSAISSSFAL